MNLVLVIGAMKAGTTALFHLLSRHPEIEPASQKEPDFFSRDEVFERGRGWYEALWSPEWEGWRLEASVSYTKRHLFPRVVERMREAPYRFRFVYLVRDPVARIESHLRHAATDGWRESESDPLSPHLVQTSRYAWQLEPYVEAFGEERVVVLDNAELDRDPASASEKVARLLGVPPVARPPGVSRHNPGVDRVRWNPLGRAMRPVMSRPVYQRFRRAVPESWRRRLLPLVGKRVSPEVALDAARIEALRKEIGEETLRFALRYGIDASGWLGRGS